jgi:hypothetical protein
MKNGDYGYASVRKKNTYRNTLLEKCEKAMLKYYAEHLGWKEPEVTLHTSST